MGITHFGLNLFDLAGVRVSNLISFMAQQVAGGSQQQHTLSTVVAMVAD